MHVWEVYAALLSRQQTGRRIGSWTRSCARSDCDPAVPGHIGDPKIKKNYSRHKTSKYLIKECSKSSLEVRGAEKEMDLMKTFSEEIKQYRDIENVEIELRLGRLSRGKFDTDVGPHVFGQILAGLEAYDGWEMVTAKSDEVYYWYQSIRCMYSEDSCVTQRKNRILVKDHQIGPVLDVRLGISQEIPIEMPSDEANRCVQRQRKSFLRKNVRIDCTIVTGPPVDKDSENLVSYQIELEIISARTDQEIFSALHKVHDVLHILALT